MKKLSFRKVLSTCLVGVMLISTCAVGVYAYDKYVAKADFKINLNGNPIRMTKEMVTIDGSTYLPLRALCEEILGLTVDWNGDTQTIDLWNIAKPTDRGSHEFPISKGVGVVGDFKAKDGFVTYEISVPTVTRGSSIESELRQEWRKKNPFKEPENNVGERNDYDTSKKYNEAKSKYEEKYNKARQEWMDKENEYIAKLLHLNASTVKGLSNSTVLTNQGIYELMKVKVRLDIKPSGLAFEYSTAAKDFTPYCGEATVDGLQRRFVEYEVITPDVSSELGYAGKTILTDGVSEGYMYFAVYKNDATPRVMYKGGQYLALY